MTDTPTASGVDLARQALAAYKATAKSTPTPQAKKPRRTMRVHRGERTDPQGLAGIIGRLTAEQGWTDNLDGGNVIDQWDTLCPQFVGLIQPVHYDDASGRLDLRPGSHVYAAQLRLLGGQLAKQINDKLGRTVVRTIRVLPVGNVDTTPRPAEIDQRPDLEAPVRTRADGCPGYQDARAVALEHRPEPRPADPYVEQAMRRQEAALRASRPADTPRHDTEPAAPVPDSVEQSLARARAYARQQRAGSAPRTAFDPT